MLWNSWSRLRTHLDMGRPNLMKAYSVGRTALFWIVMLEMEDDILIVGFAGPYLCMEVFSDRIAITAMNTKARKACTYELEQIQVSRQRHECQSQKSVYYQLEQIQVSSTIFHR
jgi:hypothetical protein